MNHRLKKNLKLSRRRMRHLQRKGQQKLLQERQKMKVRISKTKRMDIKPLLATAATVAAALTMASKLLKRKGEKEE